MTGARFMRSVSGVAALAAGIVASDGMAGAAPDHWPDLPIGVSAIVVADPMMHNGVSMRVLEVRSQRAREDVLRAAKAHWHGLGLATRQRSIGPWESLSAIEGEWVMTWMLRREAAEAEGFLAASRFRASPPPRAECGDVPRPPDADCVSRTESTDSGRRDRTIILEGRQTPVSTAAWYRGALARLGYLERGPVHASVGAWSGQLLHFDRDGRRVSIMIVPRRDRGAFIIVHSIVDDAGATS